MTLRTTHGPFPDIGRKRPDHRHVPAHAPTARRAYPYAIILQGTPGMASLTAGTISRVEHARSRQLICASRRRIASARALMGQSRQAMRRQNYVRVVFAWCQATLRFERATTATRGQVSHSICYACFAPVFQELAPGTIPPPRSISER